MKPPRAMWAAYLWAWLCAVGCGDGGNIVAPKSSSDRGPLLVSDASPADGGSAETTYAYVSLPPGSVRTGVAAAIRNRATGEVVAAAVVNGGVDPVRVTAATGDTLELNATDSASGEQEFVDEVKKNVPPVVVRSDPPRGATDSPTLRVGVVFSEPVNVASITLLSVRLTLRDQAVAGAVVLSADGLTADFVPEDSLVPGATYTLIVTRGVQDRSGMALAQEYRTEFTVEASTGPTITLSTVAAGGTFTCALSTAGEVYCWGIGEHGELGNADLATRHRPTKVAMASPAVELQAGHRSACALTDSGVVLCWGNPRSVVFSVIPVPTDVLGSEPMWHSVAGGELICALDRAGTMACIGSQVSAFSGPWYPATEPGLWVVDTALVAVTVGPDHDCYLIGTGAAICAGDNSFGQIGNGATNAGNGDPIGDRVIGDLRFEQIAAGDRYTCALAQERAYCWGINAQGELGTGGYEDASAPVAVAGGLRFVAMDVGSFHTCALTADGTAYCWGDNRGGQLGDGTRVQKPQPTTVLGELHFRSISAGLDHTCAISLEGILYCWGSNAGGKLGDGSTSDALVPIKAAYQP